MTLYLSEKSCGIRSFSIPNLWCELLLITMGGRRASDPRQHELHLDRDRDTVRLPWTLCLMSQRRKSNLILGMSSWISFAASLIKQKSLSRHPDDDDDDVRIDDDTGNDSEAQTRTIKNHSFHPFSVKNTNTSRSQSRKNLKRAEVR